MPHTRLMVLVSMFALIPAAVIEGCGSGTATNGDDDDDKPAADSGADIGQPSSGDGGSGGSCVDAGPADDRPACNACAYANCCKQIDDCANDPNCTAFDACEAACDPSDIQCLLLCQEEYDTTTAQAVGACAQQKCATECPAPSFDAGNDFDAF